MDFTHQQLKRNKKNSILLEKEENIEIRQNSTSFSKSKRTFIRERLYHHSPHNRCTSEKKNQTNSKHKAAFATSPKDIVLEEKDRQEKFEQRVHDTCDQLTNLEQNINHEIEKLQKERSVLLRNTKMETKKKSQTKKGRQKETWADHFTCNREIANEKFSFEHQCICTSPRYADDKDLAPRPRMRTVGSQMTARREKCLDQGALGDHTSFTNVKLKNENKLREDKAIIETSTQNEHTINCYYGIIDHQFCNYSVKNSNTSDSAMCHYHQKYQQFGAPNNRDYSCDDFYYDGATCACNSQCQQNAATTSNRNRRQRTDLNTDYFYCRPTDRSRSPSENCKKKAIEIKNNNNNNKELHEARNQHKKSERENLKEQTNKRPSSKTKEAKEKREKFSNLLSEDKVSEILKYFDRYIDDHDQKERKVTQNSTDNSFLASTSVEFNRKSQKLRHADARDREFVAGNDVSLETLQMLKRMKFHAYKPTKPKGKFDDSKQQREAMNAYKQQEKKKNYQRYTEKYAKENEAKKTTQSSHLRNFSFVEDLEGHEDFIYAYNERKESPDSFNDQVEFKEQFRHGTFDEQGSSEYRTIDHNDYENIKKRSQDNTDTHKESRSKEEKDTDTLNSYDANKARESLGKRLLENSLTEDKYKDEMYRESHEIVKFERESNGKSNGIKHGDSLEDEQSQIECPREDDRREYRDETEKENLQPYRCEVEKNSNSENGEKIKNHKNVKTEDQQATEITQPLQTVVREEEGKEMLHSPESNKRENHDDILKRKEEEQKKFGIMTKFTEKLQEHDEQESGEVKPKSSSSAYNHFKHLIDHTLGIYIHRSSQTENNVKPEMIEKISKQTFTEEINSDYQLSQRPSTLEKVLVYLENFLKYPQSAKEQQRLHLVASAANDLITKLSSCKSLQANQVLVSQEDLKDRVKSLEDISAHIIEKDTTQDSPYKDPETPDSSTFHLKSLAEEKENLAVSAETSEIKNLIEKKKDFHSTIDESDQLDLDIEIENMDTELTKNEFSKPELDNFQTQADSQQRKTLETQQRYQDCKENQHGETTHSDLFNKQEDQEDYCEPYMESEYIYRDLPSSSREPVFDPDLIPSKGILKSCCRVDTSKRQSCNLESYRSTSVISFNKNDHVYIQEGSTMDYNQKLKTMAQDINENSVSQQSNLKITETTTIPKLLIYPDCKLENNSSISYGIKIPAFNHCPCMWDTYVKMVATFYKEKQKQKQIIT